MPAQVPTTTEFNAAVASLNKQIAALVARVAALEALTAVPRYGTTRYR